MKHNFAILAVVSWLWLAGAAVLGWRLAATPDDLDGYVRHFVLGLGAALFACLVHVVLFMYFVVQDKIIAQSILHHGLSPVFSGRMQPFKSRALRLSLMAIAAVGLTAGLGAAGGGMISPHWHGGAALAALAINAGVSLFQFRLIENYYLLYDDAFGSEDSTSSSRRPGFPRKLSIPDS